MSPSKRKYRGTSRTTALKLFGLTGQRKMEKVEERVELASVLRLSDQESFKRLARESLDPLNSQTSFAQLAERCGLNYHMITTEYKKLQVASGTIRAARHIPDLMEQVAEDAKSRFERCRSCKGDGKIDDKECPTCSGEGQVWVLGNADRLKLIFETFQLTGKGGGVAVNVDLRRVDKNESLEDLASTMGKVLEGNDG